MKKIALIVLAIALPLAGFAAGTKAAKQTAAEFLAESTRTKITAVYNKDGNPCMDEGKSYKVEIQVRKGFWNGVKQKVVYTWETVNEVLVSKDGSLMEVCGE